jgi:hypothetical protein
MYEQPTAREQFARDIMLVLENDRRAYEYLNAVAKRLNSTHEFAEEIRNYVEQSILQEIRPTESVFTISVGRLLIHQICLGWGLDPYYDMAKQIMERQTESTGV